MIVFDVKVDQHPRATPPDFSKQYKKAETIKAKEQAWKDEGGWKTSPANCVITQFLVADPENPEKDIELPVTSNSLIQFVEHIVSIYGERHVTVGAGCVDPVVVADDITYKTCVLANTIIDMIAGLKASENLTEDDVQAIVDLKNALAELYSFRLDYIQNDHVYGNCHNLAKTLKWDALDGTVPQEMLRLSEKATRLAMLYRLASLCGLQ